MVHPPSRGRELVASGGASLHPPSQRRQLCEGRPRRDEGLGRLARSAGASAHSRPTKKIGASESWPVDTADVDAGVPLPAIEAVHLTDAWEQR